jgi:transglutaminase-like putative cysteine protease
MKLFSQLFSPQVEDSLRLRILTLAALWLGALALAWVGGNLWMSLAGGGLGTLGHGLGWYWRNRRSLIRSLLIAGSVMALSFFMRSQMLEAFSGNWLPIGQFLVLVQALASFDSRTRGGLYAGIVLSGSVLFFASQQAFDPSFGVFVMGFVVVLLAFLTVAFLEDGIRGARVHWVHARPARPAMLPYWIGVACAVFVLAGVAFWLMPRGELSLIGPPQVTVVPYAGGSLGGGNALNETSLAEIARMLNPDDADELLPRELSVNDTGPGPTGPDSELPLDGPAGPSSERFDNVRFQMNVFGAEPGPDTSGDTVFFVRSKVSSYWQGRSLEHFDKGTWRTDTVPSYLTPSTEKEGVWFNRDSLGRDNRILYYQTFYVQQDQPDAVFMGYRSLSVFAEDGSLDALGVHPGNTYRVLSAYPRHSPERLRRDSTWVASRHLVSLPPGSDRMLRLLAGQITNGARSDFDAIGSIVGYLSQQGSFDPARPGELAPSVTLEEFLVEGKPGNAMNYATATVMLARASGLPARLAVGYLPGIRDPLSGAYKVRQRDAHAWAEVYFARHGWVPFDSSPRQGEAIPGKAGFGVGYLFQGGVGDDVYQAVKSAPSELVGNVLDGLRNPVFSVLGPVVLLTVLLLRWALTRSNRKQAGPWVPLNYRGTLSGEHRRELLKLYSRLEKLLRRKSGLRRKPWQTVGDYAGAATVANPRVRPQLDWFTQAVWQAAYNPGDLPTGLVKEARRRLAGIKAALKQGAKTTSAPPRPNRR